MVPSRAAQTAFVPEISKAIIFMSCLISHSSSPNRELSNDILDVVVQRRKVTLHASSHLTPTEAGPALIRGRLTAFGKCTNGVALSKGGPNLASVRLTL